VVKRVRVQEGTHEVQRATVAQAGLLRVCVQAVGFFVGEVNRAALPNRLPNPLLGEVSPRDTAQYGRHAVAGYLKFASDPTWLTARLRTSRAVALVG